MNPLDSGGGSLDEKSLGTRLQAARKAAHLTQQELCQKADLSYSTLAKIERGAIKTPSVFTIQRIAAALNMSLDSLLGLGQTTARRTNTARTKSGASFIYFDINGCLVRFFQRAFTRLAEVTGAPADIAETAFWHYNDEACRGTMSMNDFNAALAQRLGVASLRWQDYYLDAVEPITEMQDLLRWTAERYRCGLITNIMPGIVPALKERGLLPDIAYDAVVESSEVGSIKPEPAIFEIATARSATKAEEILLIDDTRANLIAAEQAGWNVLWFDGYRLEDAVAHIRAALEPTTND